MATAKQTFNSNLNSLNDVINAKLGITSGTKRTIAQILSAVSNMHVVQSIVVTEYKSLEDNKSLYIIDPNHDNQMVGTYAFYRVGELLFIKFDSLTPIGDSEYFELVNFPTFTFDPIKLAYNYIDASQTNLGGEVQFSLVDEDSSRVRIRYYSNSDMPAKNASNLQYATGQWFCLKVFSFIDEFENFDIDINSETKAILDNKNNKIGSYTYYKLGQLLLINFESYDTKEELSEGILEDFPIKLYASAICSFADYDGKEPIYGNLNFKNKGKFSGALSTQITNLTEVIPHALNQWFTVVGN